jgi:hypothetical protein
MDIVMSDELPQHPNRIPIYVDRNPKRVYDLSMKPKAGSGKREQMRKEVAAIMNADLGPIREYLARIGQMGGLIGGKAVSPAKRNAARKNGKLGGRPKGGKNKPVALKEEEEKKESAKPSK